MTTDKKPNTHYMRRVFVMLPSVILTGLAVALMAHAGIGADAYSSLQIALSTITGLSVGVLSIICNVLVISAFFFINRSLLGIGSVAFALGVGTFINIFSNIFTRVLPIIQPFWLSVLYACIGTFLMAFSIANYLPLGLGTQPVDMIAITIGKALHKSVGTGLFVFNAAVFVIAFLLGAPWGVGTLLCVFGVGKLVDIITPKWTPVVKKLAGLTETE